MSRGHGRSVERDEPLRGLQRILLNGPKNLLMGFKEDSDVWIYLVKVDFWDAV